MLFEFGILFGWQARRSGSGGYLRCVPRFKVADCDPDPESAEGFNITDRNLKAAPSSQVNWNVKSSRKRSSLRLTAWFGPY